jgi:hypothetical protein
MSHAGARTHSRTIIISECTGGGPLSIGVLAAPKVDAMAASTTLAVVASASMEGDIFPLATVMHTLANMSCISENLKFQVEPAAAAVLLLLLQVPPSALSARLRSRNHACARIDANAVVQRDARGGD